MKKLLICLSLVLASCATPNVKPTEEVQKKDPLVILNCPDLPKFDSTQEVNMGDLLLIIVENANQYYLCQASALNLLPKTEKPNDTTAGTTKD